MAREDETIDSGSAVVHLTGDNAKKKLKGKNKEKLSRFFREIQVLKNIQEELNLDNVVKIESFDTTDCSYTMRRYDGSAPKIFDQTKGNVKLVVKLLIPIIESLRILADRKIYHRDLKPDNLLVDQSDSNNLKLVLADFGCVFVKSEQGRLTDDFRAVGAMHFRAPEYQYGRVEDVTETGDIFAIGKIIWSMVNGVDNEAFPYTLWFPPEYNLAKRFPDMPEIVYLNLLIAACVHHDPNKRISYDKLLEGLRELVENRVPELEKDKTDLLEYEAIQELNALEKEKIIEDIIALFGKDFRAALTRLNVEYKKSKVVAELSSSFQLVYPLTTIKPLYMKGSDCPLWKASAENIHLKSRICPNGRAGNKNSPLVELYIRSTNLKGDDFDIRLGYFWSSSDAIQQTLNGEVFGYDANKFYEVILKSIHSLHS